MYLLVKRMSTDLIYAVFILELKNAMVVSCARGKSFNHRSIGEGTWIIVASGLLRVRMAMTETTRSRAESVGAEACVRLAMVHGKSGEPLSCRDLARKRALPDGRLLSARGRNTIHLHPFC